MGLALPDNRGPLERRCPASGEKFSISPAELRIDERMQVPPPRLCPLERQRRRISFRNFKTLYTRECSATGRRILSMYAPHSPFPVFDNRVWWSDGWDPLSYGREFDFTLPFYEQYRRLAAEVPRFAIMNLMAENCEYSNFAWSAQSCYLVFGCVRSEECLYGHIIWDCRHCLDCLYAYRCEWCSHSIDLVDCYGVHYSGECGACRDSMFLHDCRNCADCFGCWNLRGAQYCIYNRRYPRREYEERLRGLRPRSPGGVEQERRRLAEEVRARAIFPPFFGTNNEDVSGNHIYESKNAHFCFDAKRCEDVRWCFTAFGVENSHDLSFTGAPARFCLDSLTLGNSENVLFSHVMNDCHDAACSEFCYGCRDLFGCIGLRNRAHCILNRQYSPREYARLRPRIIEHMLKTLEWGEFFPIALSPFGYNESIVSEYHPLTKEEALARGWCWRETEAAERPAAQGAPPEEIAAAGDDVLKRVYGCAQSGKPYRIAQPELEFCRRMQIPLPQLCPDERHRQRMAARFPRRLWPRRCDRCGSGISSAVPAGSAAKVYCEECYQRALY